MSQEGMLALGAVFLAGGAVVNLFITIRLLRSVSALLEIRRSITTIPDVHLVVTKDKDRNVAHQHTLAHQESRLLPPQKGLRRNRGQCDWMSVVVFQFRPPMTTPA